MKKPNRKYGVPRPVRKERLETFWLTLFCIRLFILTVFRYDPVIDNFDQSPFHHNEPGSQNKLTFNVRGAKVPVIEGHTDVRARWTANLSTRSGLKFDRQDEAHSRMQMPYCEMCFKGATDGRLDARLQAYIRSRGYASWFTVTVSPKGSYREHDIIIFLKRH